MLAIKFILKFIAILNKDASPRQVAGGMALGSIAGITPFMSLHNLLVLFVVIVLNVNITSAILAMGVFSVIAYLLDPLSNAIGYYLLTGVPALTPFWTLLYNLPVVAWAGLNNTLVLGSLVLALLLFWPLYFFLWWGVIQYREKLMARVAKWRIVTVLKSSSLYGLYSKFS